jgi:rhamnulokinase
MSASPVARYIAIDVGAESGRVLLGTLADGRVTLEPLHRFPNVPLERADGVHWDVERIEREILHGLSAAGALGVPIDGVGVDAWGCDYALLDADGTLLGLPFHYRDRRTEGVVEPTLAQLGRERLYATTGIQLLPFNTLFQLAAERDAPRLAAAATLLTIPDLLAYRLSGRIAGERTVASTTQLLDVRSGEWARDLLAELRVPDAILPPLVEAGSPLGPLRAELAAAAGLDPAPQVIAVAAHDTASAVVAVPHAGREAAYISSGTWSLVGLELDEPVTSDDALAANLTNERGVAGTIRLLRNVTGLWLVQECRRAWERADGAYDYAELTALAAAAAPGGPLIDPDAPELLAPGDMPARIAELCRRSGQQPPAGPAATVRCVLESLACAYRAALERMEAVAGRRAELVNVVGGGARNATLCRLAADVLGRPVHAGPVEATALGNVLMQGWAGGHVGSLAQARAIAARSVELDVYEPAAERAPFDQLYARFRALAGVPAAPAFAAQDREDHADG